MNDVRFPPCERSRFMAAKNWYNKVQRNIECTTKAVPHTSPVDGCDPQTREIIEGHRCYGVPEDVYEKLPFGLDFDWSKDALPVSFCVCPLPAQPVNDHHSTIAQPIPLHSKSTPPSQTETSSGLFWRMNTRNLKKRRS